MKTTISFNPKDDQQIVDNIIKYAIAPRPICLASTINKEGEINLSPFSYFNLVAHSPTYCVFSPLRRMRDGTTKHTLDNMQEVAEVVINIVNYDIVQQQSLTSTEYPRGVNEFEKAGLTPLPSIHIKPPRVAESPVQLECRVEKIIPLSDNPGAGNLVIAEVLTMHVQSHLLDEEFAIQQDELDLVARLGGNWYCRVTKENLFEVPKPLRNLGIGIDQLPLSIRQSKVLTGNHLAMLANVEAIPSIDQGFTIEKSCTNEENFHQYAAQLLNENNIQAAWQVLLKTL